MLERLNKVRKENPRFDTELVNYFGNVMPELLEVYIDGFLFDCHIGSKEVARLAEQFIKNNKGENIGFRWSFDEVINAVQNYVNLEETEFYPEDIWVWTNVKYGDMGHIIADTPTILRIALSELTDDDYPFSDASQRAYCWLKKHIAKSYIEQEE